MDVLAFSTLNVTNIAECILELVLNSLNANATSVAIRIHAEERKIQVIDNGVGISKEKLKIIAEYHDQGSYKYWNIQDICNSKEKTLTNIRKLSDTVLITSRHCDSFKTYMKVFKVYHDPKIVEIQSRPSHGTTVTIRGFHELSLNKWNIPLMYRLIANVAMVNVQVSFSIRDDQKKEMIMAITKPHNPIKIFKLLYNKEAIFRNIWYIQNMEEYDVKFCAYIGWANVRSKPTQCVFLNNKLVYCPLILEITSVSFINTFKCFATTHCKQKSTRKAIFILVFIRCTNYAFIIENRKRTLILPSIQVLLQNIRKEILNIFMQNVAPLSNNVSRYIRRDKNLTYNCISNLNDINVHKCAFTPWSSVSQKNQSLYTIYNVKRKVTKLTISEIQTSRNHKTDLSKVDSIDCLQVDNFNTKNNLSEDGKNKTRSTASQVIDATPFFTPVSQNNNVNKEMTTLNLTEWSDWIYSDKKSYKVEKMQAVSSNCLNIYKRFDFLPKTLHKQLRGNNKLTKVDVLNELDENTSSQKLKFGLQIPDTLLHHEVDTRPCKVAKHWREFRLKKDYLQFLKILGQMNNELIVGLISQNDTKVLLLMDQHAVHERIRYENLLYKYKSQTRNYLLSVKLKDPIAIEMSVDKCNLLVSNKITFKKFGLTFSLMNDNTVIVYTVPECLNKKKYYEYKLKLNVETLLNEILQNITTYKCYGTNNLPFVIHNAIAMEACHGAIKFGDPLTLKECKGLLKLLNRTKIPTRCAHGRPSVIPLLELTELEKRRGKISQVY